MRGRFSLWRQAIRRTRGGAALLALGMITASAAADSDPHGVITSHGYAVFGKLKYGPDFTHFDYVNPDAPKGGSYRYAQTGTFDSLNNISLLGTAPLLMAFMNDTLGEQSRDEPASFYCHVCKTVTYPKDFSWTEFELRPDAKFNDGQPITVDDILFTWSITDKLVMAVYNRLRPVTEKVERTGPNSVRFTFKQKNNPTMPSMPMIMPILPKHYWEKHDVTKPSLDVPVGSGPYQISKINPGRYIEVTRNPDYWARDLPTEIGRNNFDTIRNDYYRDLSLQNEAFVAGLNDLRLETSATETRQQASLPAFRSGDIKRIEIPYENGAFFNAINLNARVPFLSDRRVREALVLAYDFEWSKRVALGGNYGRLESNFPNSEFEAKGLPSAGELKLLEPFRADLPEQVFTQEPRLPIGGDRQKLRQNLLRARDLLAQAGYHIEGGKLIDPKTGAPVSLRLLAYSPLMITHTAQFIRNARRLGIEILFRSVDAAQLRHKMRNYDYDLLFYRAMFAPLPAPGAGMRTFWSSESADTPNLYNYSGIKAPAFDHALNAMINGKNRQEVLDGMRALDRMALWEFYAIPLHHTYPTPVGQLPIAYWNKFGRPAKEQTYRFSVMTADNWWYDSKKAASLTHGAN